VPKATESAAIVSATLLTLADPSIEKEPVTSPVAKVTVLALVHEEAEPVILVASITPTVPEKTSEAFVPSGMNVKKPVESSNPKKPVLAVPEKYLNSIPRSLLSSVPGLVPPIAPPIVMIGSTIVDTVESTVVVVPWMVKLPATVRLSLTFTVPPVESKIKFDEVVLIVPVTIST